MGKVRDHPRMRGEDIFIIWHTIPLSWITPACAGKTGCSSRAGTCSPDHPRMRGEDLEKLAAEGKVAGSPPHARGRPQPGDHRRGLGRITPACAGKTVLPQMPELAGRDHPRMRGEDNLLKDLGLPSRGSPPHARGRRSSARISDTVIRITPACAGKTD